MRRIMNHDVHGVVRERTDAVGDEQAEPPVAPAESSHLPRDRALPEHDRQRDECGVGIPSEKGAHFRMRAQNRTRALRMRLVQLRVIEGFLHRDPVRKS